MSSSRLQLVLDCVWYMEHSCAVHWRRRDGTDQDIKKGGNWQGGVRDWSGHKNELEVGQ
jgi:hypothetical protein